MFIFLLFASDGCRNVCQIFSQRLVARLRKHRRKRDDDTASPKTSRWTACLRTWIKCVCTGGACVTTPSTTDAGRACIEDTRTAGWASLAKLLFQKLLHQA